MRVIYEDKKYLVIRDIDDLKKGDIVYKYTGYTYGCISRLGTAFTLVLDETPFFELPNDSVINVNVLINK